MEKDNFFARKKENRKMYKEISIIIFVLILVIGFDIFTNRYTNQQTNLLMEELNHLKQNVLAENQKSSQEQMQAIKEKWGHIYQILAFYIEHDELEKVATELTRLAANLDMQQYKEGIQQIDTAIFILQHIQEKETLNGISIF